MIYCAGELVSVVSNSKKYDDTDFTKLLNELNSGKPVSDLSYFTQLYIAFFGRDVSSHAKVSFCSVVLKPSFNILFVPIFTVISMALLYPFIDSDLNWIHRWKAAFDFSISFISCWISIFILFDIILACFIRG